TAYGLSRRLRQPGGATAHGTDTDHRHHAHAAGVAWRRRAPRVRWPVIAAAVDGGRPGAGGRSLRHVRGRHQHYRWPVHLLLVPRRHDAPAVVRIHTDADAPEI